MATEFISNSWLMPEQNNESKLSNYSLDFDGTGDYISITSDIDVDYTTGWTVSFWFNISTVGQDSLMGRWDSNWRGAYAASSWTELRWYDGSNKTFAISAPSTGTWHQAVFTNDNGTLKCYLDGTESSTGSLTSNYDLTINRIGGGTGGWGGIADFDGKMTECCVFDYALSASQVTDLYGTGSAVGNPMSLATKPVAYYPLGDSAFNGEFLATNNATELYENYALSFDGSDDYIQLPYAAKLNAGADGYTISSWVKINSTCGNKTIYSTEYDEGVVLLIAGDDIKHYHRLTTGSWKSFTVSGAALSTATWYHIVVTWDGSDEIKVYLDTIEVISETGVASLQNPSSPSQYPKLGDYNSLWYMNGVLSNIAFFDSALTSAQVTTLYNSGKPFDLNTFAVTPSFWWRLGAKTSFYNSTTSEWTILDEIGTNNGTGSNLGPAQTALTDGVATTNNGISAGMSSGTNKTGDAPYSSNNSVSYNMSVTAESTSVPT